MDPHGPISQHPFDDIDPIRPLRRHPLDTIASKGPNLSTSSLTQETTHPPPPSSDSSSSASSTSYSQSHPQPHTSHPIATVNTHSTPTIASSTSSASSRQPHHSHSHNQHHGSHHQVYSPFAPPVAPLQISASSLATSAAARFSQAFSPLLSARRKSTAIEIPSTPDKHKTFSYGLSSSVHTSPGSFQGLTEGRGLTSHSQEHLSFTGAHHLQHPSSSSSNNSSHFESNLSKITSFSSPRSSNRSRKTHPGGIAHVPEESSYGSFVTPPHTATAFHAGLASHFGMGSSSSQSRDYHDTGHKEGKGSIVGSGSSSVEKALKKAKVFLDEKAKPKARANSLWAFIDVTFEFDQAKFFQEHADQVFTVTHDSFWHQVDKFKLKPDRNNALQSKEVLAVQKTLLLLRLIFLYLPDRMKNGWHRRPIANMLAQVLCHKNHPRVRIFGFRLLLLWINDQTVEYPEAIYLFSNAISLDLFMYDGEDLSVDHANSSQTRLPVLSTGSSGRRSARQVSQYFELAHLNLNQELLQSDGPPICPSPSPPTFQDSIQLFQIFLGNIVRMSYVAAGSTPPAGELESINSHYPLETDGEMGDGIAVGFGIDAGLAAARFMFDIIKKYYLVKVFPECARSLQLIKDEENEFGYKACPPTILRTIISFIIQYCLDSNEFNSPQTYTSPATPILKSIVYSSEVNREIMHEIVRQGLSLPPGHLQYKDIVRGAVHIVGVWCLSGEEERPVFLRSSSSRPQVPSSVSITSLGSQDSGTTQQSAPQNTANEPYSMANSFLQRYFQLLTNVFAETSVALHDLGSNSSSDALGSTGNQMKLDSDALYHLYKDIIGLFRAIMARGQIEMDAKSWEVLLGSLLEIQRRVMGMHERLSTILSASSIDDLTSLIIETVLCAHSRCPNVAEEQWIALRKMMIDGLRFPQTVTQWAKWSIRLTHILSQEVFQVDLEAQPSRPPQASATRHIRKMSDKFRHSRFLSSKTENPMRHSIGGELLSSQGVSYSHQTYPLSGLSLQERSSRRANSIHYDPAKQVGPNSNASGTPMYAPTLLGHMGFLPGREAGRESQLSMKVDVGEVDEEEAYDHPGLHVSALTETPDATDEKIPLVKTEVMLCLIDIWDLLNQTRASQSLNTKLIPPLYDFAPWFFEAAKSSSDGGVGLPAIYGGLCRMMNRRFDQDFDPEYYQLFYETIMQGLQIDDAMIGHSILANSSRLFTLSLPGSHILVVPFMSAIRQMLLKDGHLRDGVNHFIRKQAIAILCSVSMLFYDFGQKDSIHIANLKEQGFSLVDLLPHKVAFSRLVLDLTSAEANVKPLGKFWDTHSMLIQLCGMLVVNEWRSSLETCDIGTESELLLLVLNHLYWTETSIVQSAVEAITTLAGMYQDHEDSGWIILEMVLSHLLSAMQEHLTLFQSDPRRGHTIALLYRCLTEWLIVIPASIFSEIELSKWVFDVIEIGLLSAPDPTGENDRKRALQATKQQQQLLQQQQQQQFNQQQRLGAGKKRGPNFRHTGQTIHQHHRVMISTGPLIDVEVEQQTVKEAAETTLVHLVHFMNNISSPYESNQALVTMGMDTAGFKAEEQSAVGIDKKSHGLENQKVFALNDSILITLEDVSTAASMGFHHRTRVVIRDETGRYAWDSEIFYREMLQVDGVVRPRSVQRAGSRMSERFGSGSRRRKKEMASQLLWREGIKIRDDEDHGKAKIDPSSAVTANSPQSDRSLGMEALLWDRNGSRGDGDRLDQLLHYVSDRHPDCLFDGKTPLNQLNNGLALFTGSNGNGGHHAGDRALNNGGSNGGNRRSTIDFELDRHLLELRSSLIQSDEEADEYHGSNTLMSLVVNSTWGGPAPVSTSTDDPQQQRQEGTGATDSATTLDYEASLHSTLHDRAKRFSGREIRPNNLQQVDEGAARYRGTIVGPGQVQPGSVSLMDDPQDPNVRNPEKELLGTGLRKEDASNLAKAFQLALPPESERPLDNSQQSRLLLSHLGLLCFDRFQEHNFVLLNPTASLERDLKSLDKKSGRETFKVALLYVGEGQEGEQAIMHNSQGSAIYNRFVQGLGWEVELVDHAGYMGGLERNGSNGHSAMYYCTSTLEVIFHEVVRMPTDPDDPRQVKKVTNMPCIMHVLRVPV
ncbi:Ral GTPase-activating protein subunit alpha-2 [Gamsiella multidivaricata]|nr:Ral GTPase-activating protein subunit alpha-2 [Gamsiella multidivaricata]